MGITLVATSDDVAFLATRNYDRSLWPRVLMERAIVRSACTELIAAGYTLRLNDGDTWATPKDSTVEQVMEAIMAADEETLHVFHQPAGGEREHFGWVAFVYGNDGYDVIADHTVNLDTALAATTALGLTLSEASAIAWMLADPETERLRGAVDALRDEIRTGPSQVIGFDHNGPQQRAFEKGWNAKADAVYRKLTELVGPKGWDRIEGGLEPELSAIPVLPVVPLWGREHPAMYEAQQGQLGFPMPGDWVDCSFCNDTAPRFEWLHDGKSRLQLFVDCIDGEQRLDGPGGPQFILYELDDDGASNEPTLETSDVATMLAKMDALTTALIAKGV